MSITFVETVEHLRAMVRERQQVRPIGVGTKDALTGTDQVGRVTLAGLSGVTDYEPQEFTITARAGTPLSELDRVLLEEGQYLPFDPPLVSRGATLGGTVAAGLSGAGRLRFGGVRDFVLGVRMVDGQGRLIAGGGKVVKNAAGFDLPKLMVGSCGRFGVLTEVTLKVFPRPEQWRTICVRCRDLADAVATQGRLAVSPLDLDALDIVPPNTLWIRTAGVGEATARLAQRVGCAADRSSEILRGDAEQAEVWGPMEDWSWVEPGERLIKVPVTPRRIIPLDQQLERYFVPRRYSVAGNVAWVRWPGERPMSELDQALRDLRLSGLVLRGYVTQPKIGVQGGNVYAEKVQLALDPDKKLACEP